MAQASSTAAAKSMPSFFSILRSRLGKHAPDITLSVVAMSLAVRLVYDKYEYQDKETELNRKEELMMEKVAHVIKERNDLQKELDAVRAALAEDTGKGSWFGRLQKELPPAPKSQANEKNTNPASTAAPSKKVMI
mmetsp:Transcript_935/g.1670  ORF Transcript_935/g.1670 Transcript_935/m.1670 type:complete len:135 (-) Transcript_935:746-1150(-)|eukprot:CAMPEP_0198202834 /NCGR_PEP_ID=MMETSP1445-20131203/6054_1 /TAXON_ID=36898 /ORGANISM="Pyramimonas sp., Strain CCMP2087" /LENGTH=134 /DNA_ID=CAMNT_0043873947 /DNA_START=214 /DNA_END=618 /DNA_ORIENTATION=-